MAQRPFDFLTELPPPVKDGNAVVRFLRSCRRLFGFSFATVGVVVSALVCRLFGAQHPVIYRHYLWYCRTMQWLSGIRVTVEGELPDHACVLVANHRSYIDSIMVPSPHPLAFVAKHEVKSWPFIGWGGTAMRTLWVKRSDAESRRETRREVQRRIESGMSIIIFPEGTTHRGPELLEYRMGMFKMCADGGFPIFPIAMEYRHPEVAWVSEDLFIPHAFKIFGRRHVDVALRFGEVQHGDDPVELRERIVEWTTKNVREMRANWDAQEA